MDTFEARLATFSLPNAWPHNRKGLNYSATPENLAQAGFYCRPLNGSVDNVCCYMCNKNLDGWEPSDKAWAEHRSHAPTCPLVRLDLYHNRLYTFGSHWTRVSSISSEAMAKAGFYHLPRDESDDTAICFQCGLALDGWEPTDSPRHEHERRRPTCPFLVCGIMQIPASFDFLLASESDASAVKEFRQNTKTDKDSATARLSLPSSASKPKGGLRASAIMMATPSQKSAVSAIRPAPPAIVIQGSIAAPMASASTIRASSQRQTRSSTIHDTRTASSMPRDTFAMPVELPQRKSRRTLMASAEPSEEPLSLPSAKKKASAASVTTTTSATLREEKEEAASALKFILAELENLVNPADLSLTVNDFLQKLADGSRSNFDKELQSQMAAFEASLTF